MGTSMPSFFTLIGTVVETETRTNIGRWVIETP
jgi:hypothetical protein